MRKIVVENYGPFGEPTIPHNYPVRVLNRQELTSEEKSQKYTFNNQEFDKFELVEPSEYKQRLTDLRLNDCIYFACKPVGLNDDGRPPEFMSESKPLGAHLNRPELSAELQSEGWTAILTKGELQANYDQYINDFNSSAGIRKANADKRKPTAVLQVDQWEQREIAKGSTIADFTYPISQTALTYMTTLFSIRNNLQAQFFPLQLPSLDGRQSKSVTTVQALESIYNQLAVAALQIKSNASAKKATILNATTVEQIDAVLSTLE